jgi:hypothetical protein
MSADIIHLNNSTHALRRLRLPPNAKPLLLHHHGSLFRINPQHWLHEARIFGAIQCVSTVDLMRVAPSILHWAPTAYDIDWLQAFGKEHREDHGDTIRVVQCPTDGYDPKRGISGPYKSTDKLAAAVEWVRDKGIDIELVIVHDKPWLEAMQLKASADIYFDQVKLGYGCNAVEAWGMGIPVIAGADEWTLQKMREVYGTKQLPFYEATEETIGHALLDLASSKMKRTTYGKRGLAHVRKFHDELPALTNLARLYAKAITEPADHIRAITKIPPATFRAKVPQVQIGGRRITFSAGDYTTDNPAIVTKLRLMALRRPAWGIEEVA